MGSIGGREKGRLKSSGERLSFAGERIGKPWVLEGGAEGPSVKKGGEIIRGSHRKDGNWKVEEGRME